MPETTPTADDYRYRLRAELVTDVERNHDSDSDFDSSWLCGARDGIDIALAMLSAPGPAAVAFMRAALTKTEEGNPRV